MKTINLDSSISLHPDEIAVTREMARSETKLADDRIPSLSSLLEEIPFFLLKPDSMPSIHQIRQERNRAFEHSHRSETTEERNEEDRREETHEYPAPPIEALGFYVRTSLGFGGPLPAIFLCPERIRQRSTSETHYQTLLAFVVMHEMGHYRFDMNPKHQQLIRDDYYHFMEEAAANTLALKCAEGFSGNQESLRLIGFPGNFNPLAEMEAFAAQQPPHYRLGVHFQRNRRLFWIPWEMGKYYADGKSAEKQAFMQEASKPLHQLSEDRLKDLLDQLEE